jgi:hypothetical protein
LDHKQLKQQQVYPSQVDYINPEKMVYNADMMRPRRRQHEEYWADSNKQYTRMKSSKSLENFNTLNSGVVGSYYTKKPSSSSKPSHSNKYLKKKSHRYDSIQELAYVEFDQRQPTRSQVSTDTRSSDSRRPGEFNKLSKSSSRSTEQLSNVQYEKKKRYMYDSYGRIIGAPLINSIHTSSQQIPYALNEIDQNILLSSKSKSHSTKHLNQLPLKTTKSNRVNSEALLNGTPHQPMVMSQGMHNGLGASYGYRTSGLGMQRNYIGLSESNLLSNHLYNNNNNNNNNNVGSNVTENIPVITEK